MQATKLQLITKIQYLLTGKFQEASCRVTDLYQIVIYLIGEGGGGEGEGGGREEEGKRKERGRKEEGKRKERGRKEE